MGLFKRINTDEAVSKTVQTWLDKWWHGTPDAREKRTLINELQKIVDGRQGHLSSPSRTLVEDAKEKLQTAASTRGKSKFNSVLTTFIDRWNKYILEEGVNCSRIWIPLREETKLVPSDIAVEKAYEMAYNEECPEPEQIAEPTDKAADVQEQVAEETPIDKTAYQPTQVEVEHPEQTETQSSLDLNSLGIPVEIFITKDMIHIQIGVSQK